MLRHQTLLRLHQPAHPVKKTMPSPRHGNGSVLWGQPQAPLVISLSRRAMIWGWRRLRPELRLRGAGQRVGGGGVAVERKLVGEEGARRGLEGGLGQGERAPGGAWPTGVAEATDGEGDEEDPEDPLGHGRRRSGSRHQLRTRMGEGRDSARQQPIEPLGAGELGPKCQVQTMQLVFVNTP